MFSWLVLQRSRLRASKPASVCCWHASSLVWLALGVADHLPVLESLHRSLRVSNIRQAQYELWAMSWSARRPMSRIDHFMDTLTAPSRETETAILEAAARIVELAPRLKPQHAASIAALLEPAVDQGVAA